jgi:hypothetical protein
MKAILAAAFLMLSGSMILANVTKEDVKKLLVAGVSENTIVLYIRQNAPASPLTADDLIDLKGAGASDAVLNALQDASRTSASASSYSSAGSTTSPDYAPTTYYYSYPYSYSYPYPYYYYYPYYSYPYYPYLSFSFGFNHSHFHDDHSHFHHDQIHHVHSHAFTAPHPVQMMSPHGGAGTSHGHR